MRILHYSLGFPPYRTGGMTKFCMDLIDCQISQGNEVALLWPGRMKFFQSTTEIIRAKENEVLSFEIVNPLPVSLDEGIMDIESFTKSCNPKPYIELLEQYRPDVIHIHTFMGLHKEFIYEAKKRDIRLVFTLHDFYSICPKVTMFRNDNVCDCAENCEKCPECNQTALSINKIKLLQSPLYRIVKNTGIIKKLRQSHRNNYLSNGSKDVSVDAGKASCITLKPEDYQNLRNYYSEIVDAIDVIHANSSITKSQFEKIYKNKNIVTIPISHKDIKDNRRRKDFSDKKIRLSYLGAGSRAKGYFLLKYALDKIYKEKENIELNLYFTPNEVAPYMNIHDRYEYSQLEEVFKNTDVLVAPSIWYETFGYTVLEALSYGVPVIISDRVGAKDIVAEDCGIIFEANNKEALASIIRQITKDDLVRMNNNIINDIRVIDMQSVCNEIYSKCYKLETSN